MDKIICPRCGGTDAVERVKTAYAKEIQNIPNYAYQGQNGYQNTKTLEMLFEPNMSVSKNRYLSDYSEWPRTNLTIGGNSMLRPPPRPELDNNKGMLGWFFLMSGIFYSVIFAILKNEFGLLKPINDKGLQILTVALIVFGFVIALAGILLILAHQVMKKTYTTKIIPKWSRALERWSQLYICKQAWVVFEHISGQFTGIDNLDKLLYSE